MLRFQFFLLSRYTELQIFFEELVKKKISYSPQYTTDVIIGTLGGHLGFFLGASLITLFELFELAVYIFAWLCGKQSKKHETQDSDAYT
ncbi:acid-sensing ion channel 1 [Elysia marginata]|uniref:Acid-sensing ion channel 1 n=1 Tax=Elysia marginata TaxID=1093978 RepID=A0AAV4ELA2_9GAST|nr:acid-sensing ion channel 1 [Elysia marginata]